GDGFHENQVSKSILHLAIDKLLDDNNFYFPSYELFMDDLRDYRFYNQDLCHPSEVGIAYLKEKIIAAFFTEETEKKRQGIEKENKLAAHRPLLNK
ncbi:MAG: GSCFA domain-containing protein, partial [Bacteroidales bacterium]|nr:GSCFA domain-containing protein [Bacteroidales bacterium]